MSHEPSCHARRTSSFWQMAEATIFSGCAALSAFKSSQSGAGAQDFTTAAQTALRFLLQSDVVVIPKSTHKDRMQQNFDLFDFTLTAEDMAAIEALDGGESLFFSHYDPKTVEWFMSIL